ncbi:hypothetical protein PZA18_23360, partial [Chitinimonas sp. DQS-5]|nr:hypothetical protein [Parachitinimonas caeni]
QTEYDIAGRITKTVRYATPAKLSVVAPLFSPVSGMAGQNLSPTQTQDIINEAGRLGGDLANRVERFWYDTAGRLILSADAGGMLTERTYDKSGNVLRQVQYATPVSEATLSQNETKVGKLVDPVTGKDTLQINGAEAVLANALAPKEGKPSLRPKPSSLDRISRTVYDHFNRPVYSIDAGGMVSRTDYDLAGNVLRVLQFATVFSLDGTEIPDYDGSREQLDGMSQDQLAQTLKTFDQANLRHFKNRATVARYDAAGRKSLTIDAEGYVSRTTYGVGETQQIRYRSAALHDYLQTPAAYWKWLELSKEDLAGEKLGAAQTALSSVLNGGRSTEITRSNAAGQIQSVTQTDTVQGALEIVRQYEYYGSGLLKSLQLGKVVLGDNEPQKTEYFYDQAGNLVLEKQGTTGLTGYRYDAVGNRTAKIDGRGLAFYGLPADLLAIAQGSIPKVATDAISSHRNQVHENLNLNAQEWVGLDRYTTRYQHDGLGRVIKTITPQVTEFSESDKTRTALTSWEAETEYDVFGNVVRQSEPYLTGGRNSAASSYSYYDRQNRKTLQVLAGGSVIRTRYDSFGNAKEIVKFDRKMVAAAHPNQEPPKCVVATGQIDFKDVEADPSIDSVTQITHDKLGRQLEVLDVRFAITRPAPTEAPTAAAGGGTGIGGETTPTQPQPKPVTDYYGKFTRYQYDAFGHVSTRVEGAHIKPSEGKPSELAVTWMGGYDRLGQQRYESRSGQGLINFSVSKEYDAFGQLSSKTESAETSLRTDYLFDGFGRLISVKQPVGNYFINDKWVSARREERYEYNNAGQQSRQVSGLEGVTDSAHQRSETILYGANGQKKQVTRTQGSDTVKTTYTYDAAGRVSSQTAGGQTLYLAYDLQGNETERYSGETFWGQVEDGGNWQASAKTYVVQHKRYDGQGRLTQEWSSAWENQSAAGTPQLRNRETSRQHRFAYDAQGRKCSEGYDGESFTRWIYINLSNDPVDPKATKDSRRVMVEIRLTQDDIDKNLTAQSLSDETLWGYVQQEKEFSADTRWTIHRLDADGRVLEKSQRGSSAVTRYHYDALGRLVESQDADGIIMRYDYDLLGNETRHALGAATDANGQALVQRQVVTSQLDGHGRVIATTEWGSSRQVNGQEQDVADLGLEGQTQAVRTTRYFYEGKQLMAEQRPDGVITYYGENAQGERCLEARLHTDAAGAYQFALSKTAYNAQGLKKQIATYSGQINDRAVAFDASALAAHRQTLAGASWQILQVIDQDYDGAGQLIARGTHAGQAVSGYHKQERYSYDGLGRLRQSNKDGVVQYYLNSAAGDAVLTLSAGAGQTGLFEVGAGLTFNLIDLASSIRQNQMSVVAKRYNLRHQLTDSWKLAQAGADAGGLQFDFAQRNQAQVGQVKLEPALLGGQLKGTLEWAGTANQAQPKLIFSGVELETLRRYAAQGTLTLHLDWLGSQTLTPITVAMIDEKLQATPPGSLEVLGPVSKPYYVNQGGDINQNVISPALSHLEMSIQLERKNAVSGRIERQTLLTGRGIVEEEQTVQKNSAGERFRVKHTTWEGQLHSTPLNVDRLHLYALPPTASSLQLSLWRQDGTLAQTLSDIRVQEGQASFALPDGLSGSYRYQYGYTVAGSHQVLLAGEGRLEVISGQTSRLLPDSASDPVSARFDDNRLKLSNAPGGIGAWFYRPRNTVGPYTPVGLNDQPKLAGLSGEYEALYFTGEPGQVQSRGRFNFHVTDGKIDVVSAVQASPRSVEGELIVLRQTNGADYLYLLDGGRGVGPAWHQPSRLRLAPDLTRNANVEGIERSSLIDTRRQVDEHAGFQQGGVYFHLPESVSGNQIYELEVGGQLWYGQLHIHYENGQPRIQLTPPGDSQLVRISGPVSAATARVKLEIGQPDDNYPKTLNLEPTRNADGNYTLDKILNLRKWLQDYTPRNNVPVVDGKVNLQYRLIPSAGDIVTGPLASGVLTFAPGSRPEDRKPISAIADGAPAQVGERLSTLDGGQTIHHHQQYNSFGELIKEIDGNGHATEYHYNQRGQLDQKTAGLTSSGQFDPSRYNQYAGDSQTLATQAASTVMTYTAGGRLKQITDGRGNVTEYSY